MQQLLATDLLSLSQAWYAFVMGGVMVSFIFFAIDSILLRKFLDAYSTEKAPATIVALGMKRTLSTYTHTSD
jgi:hypothetical protein